MAVGQVAVRVRRAEAAAAGDAHAEGLAREPRARRVGGRHGGRRARAARLPARQGWYLHASSVHKKWACFFPK